MVSSNTARSPFIKALPSLTINAVFIVQAIIFDWQLGTLIWIYWIEGFLIVLLGLLAKGKSLGWTLLLGIMAIYGFFLSMLTFPSEGVTYIKNGVEVSAQEFTVLSDTQWSVVLLNAGLLLAGYLIAKLIKKDVTSFGGAHVVKRLIPLHITILLAAFIPWSAVLFLVLRSLFDLMMEKVVAQMAHAWAQNKTSATK
jgi:hypothetical protein